MSDKYVLPLLFKTVSVIYAYIYIVPCQTNCKHAWSSWGRMKNAINLPLQLVTMWCTNYITN